jgi:hypothetical protein
MMFRMVSAGGVRLGEEPIHAYVVATQLNLDRTVAHD